MLFSLVRQSLSSRYLSTISSALAKSACMRRICECCSRYRIYALGGFGITVLDEHFLYQVLYFFDIGHPQPAQVISVWRPPVARLCGLFRVIPASCPYGFSYRPCYLIGFEGDYPSVALSYLPILSSNISFSSAILNHISVRIRETAAAMFVSLAIASSTLRVFNPQSGPLQILFLSNSVRAWRKVAAISFTSSILWL